MKKIKINGKKEKVTFIGTRHAAGVYEYNGKVYNGLRCNMYEADNKNNWIALVIYSEQCGEIKSSKTAVKISNIMSRLIYTMNSDRLVQACGAELIF